MVKKIVIVVITVLLSAYFIFAIVYARSAGKTDALCTDFRIEIKDKPENQYIDEKEVIKILQKAGLEPVGKKLSEINLSKIESVLKENGLIKNAECYKTIGGTIKLRIYQRTPILRVMANNGNYYIDSDGKKMPVPNDFSIYVPVATGFIDDNFAQTELYQFTLFLQKNKFWDAQIEQIYVAPNKDIELTPRVGNHQILLGQMENFEENLDKLKFFYEKGLNKVGWNKYSKINLKYKNQVICTRIN